MGRSAGFGTRTTWPSSSNSRDPAAAQRLADGADWHVCACWGAPPAHRDRGGRPPGRPDLLRAYGAEAALRAQDAQTMTDVLIAGGGIAGSTLAILLGRAGLTVELFERGYFPREKACGEGLMPGGVGVLERLGLADAIGGAPFYGVRYYMDGL